MSVDELASLSRVAVIIPALNEEESLPRVLTDIPRNLIEEIVVIDNGSSDATAEVAKECGATVLMEQQRGYGAACLAGLEYLRTRNPDIVVFLDADYSDHAEELPRLLQPLREQGCDLVIGSRLSGRAEPGSLLPQARMGNRLATFLLRILFQVHYTDLGPFRAARFQKLMQLGMRDRNFGWTVEMQALAARAGWKTTEVPVSYRRRIGESKITGTFSGTLQAGLKILSTIFRIWWWKG